MLSHFSFYLIVFTHMANYKFQNLIRIALWQHFMDNVVCFHPIDILKATEKMIKQMK
jgi:hypothetical protein